ncbi:MAG: hypothetical protein AAEJ52_11485 [Myxococcota bacterium]
MKFHEVDTILERTHHADPKERAWALRELCPCQIRVNVDAVWQRVIEMGGDPDERGKR